MTGSARTIIILLLAIILLVHSNCWAEDTITVITYSHKYDNVTYIIDQRNHQLILNGDEKTTIAPDEIRFIYDRDGKDITDVILQFITDIQVTKENKNSISPPKEKLKYSKKPRNWLKEVKFGFGYGYSHSFSDYFNKELKDWHSDYYSWGFSDGYNIAFWLEHKLTDFGIRVSVGYTKYKKNLDFYNYPSPFSLTNEFSYNQYKLTLVMYPQLGISRLKPYLGPGIGIYEVYSREHLLSTGYQRSWFEMKGSTSKFGLHLITGSELLLVKNLSLVFEAEYSYINCSYRIYSIRGPAEDETMRNLDFGGIAVRTAICLSFKSSEN